MIEVLTLQLWLLAILLALSAFFSGVEAAYLALTSIDIRQMIEKKKRWAHAVQDLKSEPHKLVITILIGNNLVNIAASTIAASIALTIFESNALGISTGIMTMLVLVFGEITPKTLAIGHKGLVTRLAAWPLWIFGILLWPLIKILDYFTRFVAKIFKAESEEVITEEEIKSVVSLGEESGSIEKEERWMINNILKFNDIEVSEIMTPRVDMFYLEPKAKITNISETIIRSGRSRLPVIDKDKVVGIIFIKDIFEALSKHKSDTSVDHIMRKPFIVPEQRKIDDLLKDFQKKKVHIGIVVDEHGSVSGLVTIEDILEEIVGEIYDETDKKEPLVRRIDQKTVIVNGGLRIERLNERLPLGLKENEEYDTISGFLLSKFGRIPRQGESLEHKKYRYIIEKADDHRIQEIRIVKI